MTFTSGNRFWENRTEHGRKKLFESPEILWKECVKYFTWCASNPLLDVQYVGKDAHRVEVPKMRAFTWTGLELFLDIESLRWYKTSESHSDFLHIITHIDKIIFTQKFEGAAAGMLNANIIARDLGLVDKKQQEIKGEQRLFNID